MNKFYKISLLISLLFLSGCAGTETQKKLERFFAERDNPTLRYKAGGSYYKESQDFYSKKNCDELYDLYQESYRAGSGEGEKMDQRIILEIAEQHNCDNRILEWRERQVREQQKQDKATMERWYKDELRTSEARRIRTEAQEKAAREKRAKVLREIRNEN